jgi:hypothetical protein
LAGDWIKMRGNLSTNPKVLRIAAILEESKAVGKQLTTGFSGALSEIVTRDVTRDITLASLLRVWAAANEHTTDGLWVGMHPEDLDHIAGVPGFGEAMVLVGWAIYNKDTDSTQLPNFLEHNAPAKYGRSSGAERQKRYRESIKKRDVTETVTRDAREEKKREEVKPIAFEVPDWVPRAEWDSFVEMRTKLKSPLTNRGKTLALAALVKLKAEGHDPRSVIDEAVLKGWKSFYAPKTSPAAANPWDGAK